MSEKVAMLEMMLLAVVSGVIATKWKGRALTLGTICGKSVLTVIYSFGGYCFMSIGRLIFLRTGEFYAYAQDIRILITDVLMGMAGIVLLPRAYLFTCHSKKGNKIFIAPICIMITMTGELIYQFLNYRNVSGAIYHCLLPEVVSIVGLMVWGELVLISRLIMKRSFARSMTRQGRLSVCVTFALVITVFVYPFLETFLSNSEEFAFSLGEILPCLIIFAAIVFGVIVSVLNNLSDRVWEITVLAVFSFTLAAYIQELFLNKRLFLMDGVNREWTLGFKALNIFVWCLIFVGIFMFGHFCKENWRNVIKFCCIAIAVMQAAGGLSLVIANGGHFETRREAEYFSTDGLYEAAADENVIVFVLDKYDGKYMQAVLDREPDFLEPLQGFVAFPDTVAQFSRTYPAITYMLTNHTFFNVPSGQNYVDWAFSDCSFWKDLVERGFHMYFYEENASYIGNSVKTYTDNYVEQGEIIKRDISLAGCIRSIHTVNCYRVMPYIVKDYFSYTDDTVNDLVISDKVWAEEQYEMDDAKIKVQLNQSGLKINDDYKAFRFIHMFGAHPPYSLDRNGNRVDESKDLEIDQYIGSMKIVYNYLDELKKLGLYENATIVITADHGENFENGSVLPEKVNIIMLVKPGGGILVA